MQNVAIGALSGEAITTGIKNTIVGTDAGDLIETGQENTIIGYRAGVASASDNSCIVIGAGSAGEGSNTTVIGAASTTKARIFGLRTHVTAITNDTSLTASDSGETFVFNDAAAVFTLPDSGGGDLTGVYFHFIVLNDDAGAKRIVCADTGNEEYIGAVLTVDTDSSDANASFAADANDSTITMDGTTTGRAGSKITVTNIATDKWHVEGTLLCSGTPATPFS